MGSSGMLVVEILKQRGFPMPPEDKLEAAIRDAILEVKKAGGDDPQSVRYKVALRVKCS